MEIGVIHTRVVKDAKNGTEGGAGLRRARPPRLCDRLRKRLAFHRLRPDLAAVGQAGAHETGGERTGNRQTRASQIVEKPPLAKRAAAPRAEIEIAVPERSHPAAPPVAAAHRLAAAPRDALHPGPPARLGAGGPVEKRLEIADGEEPGVV